jgi:hypothetical protein
MADITYTVTDSLPEDITGFEQFSQSDNNLIGSFQINNLFNPQKHFVQLHVYSTSDTLLESDTNYNNYKLLSNAQSAGKSGASVLSIDPVADSIAYGYVNGGVKLLYHFVNDLFTTGKSTAEFFINGVSEDRTEVRLLASTLEDGTVEQTALLLAEQISNQSYFEGFRLNFGNNDLAIGINIGTIEYNGQIAVAVKLYEPLSENYGIGSTLNIVEIVADSAAYEIDTQSPVVETSFPTLKSPNFNIDIQDNNVVPSEYFSYDELFSYPVNNSNSQIFSVFNEKGIEISIDYTNYSDYVHFSSAQERLINFKYKLDLIHTYSASLSSISTVGPALAGASGSTTYYNGLIQGVVGNFDHYERFLYYESGSSSWPKTNNTKPYINVVSTAPTAVSWYTEQVNNAAYYDSINNNLLVNTIPTYLRDDVNNENYLTFIHMIGQHFDNLWLYAKAVSDKYDADNRLDFGISRDLVAEALKNFGVQLYTSNKSIQDLFTTIVGQSYQSGSEVITNYLTGSYTGSDAPIQPSSYDNYQKEVYKRIYHNLPLLLKSKGTERGLRALINCFGIPSDIFDIKLYGGRNVNERPFYGDYRYSTSSLNKIRLDNTGSIVTGSTLSQYTSIVKREYKYTDDLHSIELGFSPTDNVDNYIISKSLSTASLASFNIEDYLGDPRNLYSDNYSTFTPAGSISGSLVQLTDQIMSGSDAYNVQDFVRLIKFFDNTIFKMVKDFIPARSTASTGIIIKPHVLGRSKAKSVILSGSRPEYTASIDTAFTEGGNGGAFISRTQGIVDGELNTSYNQNVQTPFGIAIVSSSNHQQASYNGELRNSRLTVTNGELNRANLFKIPSFFGNTFDINRWLNKEGVCILKPYSTLTNVNGEIYYSSSNNTYYLNSGSWSNAALFSGLSATSMVYEITSSNIPTASFQFPFNTDNYANYTTHSLTASNTGVEGICTSSVNIQVAVCDVDITSNFRTSVKNAPEEYNVTSWFVTGSQNLSSNMNLTIVKNPGQVSIYNNLLSNATASTFPGLSTDTYTLTVQDTKIPLTCTYTYPVSAGICSVIPQQFDTTNRNLIWYEGTNMGTTLVGQGGPTVLTPYNYGLAAYFVGVNPNELEYKIQISSLFEGVLAEATVTPPNSTTVFTSGTGTFFQMPGYQFNMFRYVWSYGPTVTPQIQGNVALFKIEYTPEFIATFGTAFINAQEVFSGRLSVRITANEQPPDCTPYVTLIPPAPIRENEDPCCFIGSTLVTLPDYTQVRIDSLKKGDEVLSYNENTGETLTSKVVTFSSPTKKDIVKFTLSNGTEIEAARNHPLWVVGKGWSSYAPDITMRDHKLAVAQLSEGDMLLTQEGLEVELLTMYLDENREYEIVYNIGLDNHYTYYANGILAHNKGPADDPGRTYCSDYDDGYDPDLGNPIP